MTTATLLLAELGARGVHVRADGGQLRLRPADALTPELRQRVLAAKPDLLRLLASQPPLKQGLAVREVSRFPAALLCNLPIATTLVLRVPSIRGPVLVATHQGCGRRSFSLNEWMTLVVLAEHDKIDPATFASWARGQERGQLAASSASPTSECSVAYVLGKIDAQLQAVVLEGQQP